MRSAETLRNDALRIWRAAVEAVQPAPLIPEIVTCHRTHPAIGDEALPLDSIGRIVVVGGGKAAGAMAAALEAALPDRLRVEGWVNVPADAMPPAHRITLHPARPPGMNEPTPEAAYGVRRMLGLVSGLNPDDVCVCLLSGGGSALLPAPVHGLSVEDKAVLARELSARGAPIGAINAVRRELSEIKGGGLARACRAGRLFSLVLSDVPGDSLADIASGPTAPSMPDPKRALRVLAEYDLDNTPVGRRAAAALDRRLRTPSDEPTSRVTNLIIGNNAAAVDAAGVQAERLGYSHAMTSARQPEGLADELGRRLAEIAAGMRRERGPG